jgi:hypothetical protein
MGSDRAVQAEDVSYAALRAQSVAAVEDALGDCPDLTVVRHPSERGDELTLLGWRSFLSHRRFREISVDELAHSAGRTALLIATGGFTGWAPYALGVAELRFERVIVLPSSFDVSQPAVSDRLARTRATVFASERKSYEAIRELCTARLALDGAFFYDYGPYRREGAGVVRGDHDMLAPEQWLEQVAGCEIVRTDQAQVMIAGALLGKQVECSESCSWVLDAIADYALLEFPVRRVEAERAAAGTSRNRVNPRVHVVERIQTIADGEAEFAMVLDDTAEPAAGAIERLVGELDAHPEAAAAVAHVVGPAGAERPTYGVLREWDGIVEFVPGVDDGGACDWVAGAGALVRRSALAELPLEPSMGEYAAREWCYRMAPSGARPIRRCADAGILTNRPLDETPRVDSGSSFEDRCFALPHLTGAARFHRVHGGVPAAVFEIVPTLIDLDGGRDVGAAATLLTLVDAAGPDVFLALWAGGGLDRLLGAEAAAHAEALRAVTAALERSRTELDRVQASFEYVARRVEVIERTRAWRLATTFYRLRDRIRRQR